MEIVRVNNIWVFKIFSMPESSSKIYTYKVNTGWLKGIKDIFDQSFNL